MTRLCARVRLKSASQVSTMIEEGRHRVYETYMGAIPSAWEPAVWEEVVPEKHRVHSDVSDDL